MRVTPNHAEPSLVLVLAGDTPAAANVARWLGEAGLRTLAIRDVPSLLDVLARTLPDLILVDLDPRQQRGLEALQKIRSQHATLPLVVLGEREGATRSDALRAGAYDVLSKPLERSEVLTATRNGCERHRLTRQVSALQRRAQEEAFEGIIGRSAPMRRLFGQANEVAPSHISLLLRGEPGTGKTLLAHAIHRASARAEFPLVSLDCAGLDHIPTDRFAGAGTLVLEELCALPPRLHGPLRRALQGTDVRVIATSTLDVAEMVERGTFDPQLHARICAYTLELPALRERGGDIRLLLDHALATSTPDGSKAPRFDACALDLLLRYPWPGNVTELRALARRTLPAADDGWIRARHLPEPARNHAGEPAANGAHTEPEGEQHRSPLSVVNDGGTLAELERAAIERELELCNGNVTAVGRKLGIGRTTLYRRLKQYGLR